MHVSNNICFWGEVNYQTKVTGQLLLNWQRGSSMYVHGTAPTSAAAIADTTSKSYSTETKRS